MIGHSKLTAGMASIIKSIYALNHKVLPATIGVNTPNSHVDFSKSPYYINSETRPWFHDPAKGIRRYAKGEVGRHFTGIAVELAPAQWFSPESRTPGISLSELFYPTPGYTRTIAAIFLLSFLIQVLSILTPLYLQFVIDQGLNKGDMDIVFLIAVLFVIVTIAKSFVSYCRGLVLLDFSNEFGFQLVSGLFRHLLRLPMAYFEKRELGDIVSRFSSLEAVKQLVAHEMISALVDGILSFITLLILFLYSPFLAILVIVSVFLSALLRSVTIPTERNRRQEAIFSDAKQQSRFLENIKNIQVTKLYGIERDRSSDWQNTFIESINAGYRLNQLQLGVASVQNLIFGLEHLASIYFGVLLVNAGDLSLGQLMSFVFLKQHFSHSLTALLPKLAELRMVKIELERIADIALQEPETTSSPMALLNPRLKGRLELQHVYFGYSRAQAPTIEKMSLLLDPGNILLISGRSGSGKSTLLKLILGLQKPQSGKLLFDGLELEMLGLDTLRDQVSGVLHGDSLLSGDIAYNINLGREPANEQRLITASTRSGLHELIRRLPLGYRTRVGEMGNRFSAGQVQRILIARALFRLPRILILDEALSHLGSNAAVQLLETIRGLGITTIVVSHDQSLKLLADLEVTIPGASLDT